MAPVKPEGNWMRRVSRSIGGRETAAAIGADVGISALFAIGGYLTDDEGPLKDASPGTKRLLNAVFAVPMVAGIPGVKKGILLPDLVEQWREREVPDFLMTALTSVIATLGVGMNDKEMIQSAAMLAALFAMAGHLEDGVKRASEEGIRALEESIPKQVKRRVPAADGVGHTIETVDLKDIKKGDYVVVPHGEMVPVDGKVVEIHVDGKPDKLGGYVPHKGMFGESGVKNVRVQEEIVQGAVTAEKSQFVVQATKEGNESFLNGLADALRAGEKDEKAARSVHGIEKTVKNIYIPVMLAAVATQFAASYYFEKKKHGYKNKIHELEKAVNSRDSDSAAPVAEAKNSPDEEKAAAARQNRKASHTLVGKENPHAYRIEKSVKRSAELAIKMAPCAITASMLVLPFVKNKLAAEHGINVFADNALEKLKDVTHVLTDVRGTLTTEKSVFKGLHLWDGKALVKAEKEAEQKLMGMIGKAEAESVHPVAKTLWEETHRQGIDMTMQSKTVRGRALKEQSSVVPGLGVKGNFFGHRIAIGNEELHSMLGHTVPPELVKAAEAHGASSFFRYYDKATKETRWGIAAFEDTLREGVVDALHDLRKRGVKVSLVTGMKEAEAKKILKQLEAKPVEGNPIQLFAKVPSVSVDGKIGKDQIVKQFSGGKNVVMAIGDAENDAQFLLNARESGGIGAAVSSGGMAAVTENAASIVMKGVDQLPELMKVSKRISTALMVNVSAAAAWMALLVGSHCFGHEMKPQKASIAHETPTFLLTIASLVQSFRATKSLPSLHL